MSAVERALAWRARLALEAGPWERDGRDGGSGGHAGPDRGNGGPAGEQAGPDRDGPDMPIDPGLLDSLRHHLLAGETHYPDRPGMAELRRQVGAALPGVGYPARDADGVLITASEGESMFVALLGLAAGRGTRYTGSPPGRHHRLFRWMGLVAAGRAGEGGAARQTSEADVGNTREARQTRVGGDDGVAEVAFDYTDRADDAARPHHAARAKTEGARRAHPTPRIHAIGDRLFRPAEGRRPDDAPDDAADVIVVGSLDGLRPMHPFRLGFVAAPPAALAGIAKWKQASSICSPAPSQRAALWALGVRP